MISAGQVPSSSAAPAKSSELVLENPSQKPNAPATLAEVLAPVAGMDSCMMDRGDVPGGEKSPGGEQWHSMKDYSVAGLTSYSMLTAVLMGLPHDEESANIITDELPKWHVLYEPNNDLVRNDGSVVFSPLAPRVSFNRVCHEDTAWTVADSSFSFNMGSLKNRGSIQFDDAATNGFTDIFGEIEHEEQAALFKAMAPLNMENWSNRMVHYLGAFSDSLAGPTFGKVDVEVTDNGKTKKVKREVVHCGMAGAFRSDDEKMKKYLEIVRQRLVAPDALNMKMYDSTNGILMLLKAFAPTRKDEDKVEISESIVLGAIKLMSAEPQQAEFGRVLRAGLELNKTMDLFPKYEDEIKKIVIDKIKSMQRAAMAGNRKVAEELMLLKEMSERQGSTVGVLMYILKSEDKNDLPLKQQILKVSKDVDAQLGRLNDVLTKEEGGNGNPINEALMTRDQAEFLQVILELYQKMRASVLPTSKLQVQPPKGGSVTPKNDNPPPSSPGGAAFPRD